MAGGQTFDANCLVQILFKLAHQNFTDNFLLHSPTSLLLGSTFFSKHEQNNYISRSHSDTIQKFKWFNGVNEQN